MRTTHRLADEPALQFLASRIDYERTCAVPYHQRDFRLDRMRDLLARLGDPHDALRIVHVAGTKGKGSTAAMVAAVLSAAGYKTGLYTSPHLERVEERLMIDGAICPADEFARLVASVQPVVAELDALAHRHGAQGPTYFEIVTALAMLRFAQSATDLNRRRQKPAASVATARRAACGSPGCQCWEEAPAQAPGSAPQHALESIPRPTFTPAGAPGWCDAASFTPA